MNKKGLKEGPRAEKESTYFLSNSHLGFSIVFQYDQI